MKNLCFLFSLKINVNYHNNGSYNFVFFVGTRDLYLDIKEYIRISSSLRNGKSVRDLRRKELETYFQVCCQYL